MAVDHMSAKTGPLNTLVESNTEVSQVTPREFDVIEVSNNGLVDDVHFLT